MVEVTGSDGCVSAATLAFLAAPCLNVANGQRPDLLGTSLVEGIRTRILIAALQESAHHALDRALRRHGRPLRPGLRDRLSTPDPAIRAGEQGSAFAPEDSPVNRRSRGRSREATSRRSGVARLRLLQAPGRHKGSPRAPPHGDLWRHAVRHSWPDWPLISYRYSDWQNAITDLRSEMEFHKGCHPTPQRAVAVFGAAEPPGSSVDHRMPDCVWRRAASNSAAM